MQKKIATKDFNKVLEQELSGFAQWKHVFELQNKTTSCCKKINKLDCINQWNDRHIDQLRVNQCKPPRGNI